MIMKAYSTLKWFQHNRTQNVISRRSIINSKYLEYYKIIYNNVYLLVIYIHIHIHVQKWSSERLYSTIQRVIGHET